MSGHARHPVRSALRNGGLAAIVAAMLGVTAVAQAPRRFPFEGTVTRVDATSQTVSVSGQKVEGWMDAMTMNYRVQPADILQRLRPGDRISATVMAGNTTTLFDVKVEGKAPPVDDLPPVVWICPSPGEESVLEDKPGKCPKSNVPLRAVRLVTAYSCLKVQLIIRDAPGTCPIDHTALVPITAALVFTCKDDPSVHDASPGRCADGSPRVKTFERRPHGDHNPRHGGSLFMSADQFVHVEGTLIAPNLFRVYFYDDLTRPLAARGFSARVLMTDQNADPTGPVATLHPTPAIPSALEGVVPAGFPVRLKLAVVFKPGEREQLFDFTFNTTSVEP
jgi:Cu/Ag efflux protein CusF